MAVMSIRIEDSKRKALKIIASIEGKTTMGGIVSELIDEYIEENKDKLRELSDHDVLKEIMKMSEPSFFRME